MVIILKYGILNTQTSLSTSLPTSLINLIEYFSLLTILTIMILLTLLTPLTVLQLLTLPLLSKSRLRLASVLEILTNKQFPLNELVFDNMYFLQGMFLILKGPSQIDKLNVGLNICSKV